MRLFPGDEATAMTGAIAEAFPDAAYQRRTVHFYRNVAWRRGNRLQATLEILRGEGREDSTPPSQARASPQGSSARLLWTVRADPFGCNNCRGIHSSKCLRRMCRLKRFRMLY